MPKQFRLLLELPPLHRTVQKSEDCHVQEAATVLAQLETTKAEIAHLYARWEQLEQIGKRRGGEQRRAEIKTGRAVSGLR